jgi:hypothetical protein
MNMAQDTALEVASIVVGAGGLALAAASLTWQAVTWRLSGGRVKAELLVGAIQTIGNMSVTFPAGHPLKDLDDIADQGFTRKSLFLSARNTGRLPVVVEQWVVLFPGGIRIRQLNSRLGPDLPHRLDVGESAQWAIELETIMPTVQWFRAEKKLAKVLRRRSVKVRIEVGLGDGKVIRTPEKVRL